MSDQPQNLDVVEAAQVQLRDARKQLGDAMANVAMLRVNLSRVGPSVLTPESQYGETPGQILGNAFDAASRAEAALAKVQIRAQVAADRLLPEGSAEVIPFDAS